VSRDLRHGEHRDAGRSELKRERDAVQPGADAGYRSRAALLQLEGRGCCDGAIHEQPDGVEAGELDHRR
jgi:hypothetical protein